MKLAILGGISQYKFQTVLNACQNDAETLKAFLEATNDYTDICFLGPNTTGTEAKKLIAEFVQKHRNDKVDELFFYFSGHGDRTEDDFFYAMSDYKADRRETTGLRNSELDSLIRNFAPELTIKIIDACYSGSTYIKADDDITPVIQKSAKENQLKKLYFFYSSAADQTSWAGPKFSYFTLALFESLAEQNGPVRYRDLIAAVADEMHRNGAPKPTFVVQADNLETFVEMNAHLSDLLKAAIGIPQHTSTSSGTKNFDDQSEEAAEIVEMVQSSPQSLSLAELAALKAREIYCTEEEARANIQLVESKLNSESWPKEITDAYEIEVIFLDERSIPNKLTIAKWIQSLNEDPVFATPVFETQIYTVNEYQEVPKKPSSKGSLGLGAFSQMQKLFGEDKEYKLELVKKERQVISGFKYTVDPVAVPRELLFRPKHPSLEQYAATLVFLFSRRSFTCLYSIEHLPYIGWDKTQPAQAGQRKQLTVPLKSRDKILSLASTIISEISEFVGSDARQRLS